MNSRVATSSNIAARRAPRRYDDRYRDDRQPADPSPRASSEHGSQYQPVAMPSSQRYADEDAPSPNR